MHEERLLILKMVEAGKITAQEAVELLEAMEAEEPPKQDKIDDTWRRIEKQGQEFSQKIERAVERLGHSIEMKLEDSGLSEQLSNLPRLLSKIPFLNTIAAEVHEFSQEYQGSFAPDLSEIPISLKNVNGSIVIEGWDQDTVKLVVTQKVKAKDREQALDKLIQIELPETGTAVDGLRVEVQEQSDTSVSYHLSVPRKNPYLVTLESTNGGCRLANLLAKRLRVKTVNGSVTVKQTKADSIYTETCNGSNNLDYVEAEDIKQHTANGSIHFVGSSPKIDCDTVNGSVRVLPLTFAHAQSQLRINTVNGGVRCLLPQMPNMLVKVDAATAIGRVKIGLNNFVPQTELRSGGRHTVVGTVTDDSGTGKMIAVHTRVGTGSIYIGHEREKHGAE